jgi:hypothetical protein
MHDPSLSPDGIASVLGRATNWFLTDSPSKAAKWILLLAAALYFTTVIFFQLGPTNCWASDVPILLDGGWRIFNGQMPYRDFYLALGPIDYSLIALGMAMTNASPQAIAVANALFGVVVGTWGWFLCRRRMPFIPSALIAVWLILTATSPSPLGVAAHIMSSAMIYNRHGYAILSLILIECAFAFERNRFWGGISSGAALMLLAFLKLNFFCAGFLLIFTTIPLRRSELQRAWSILAGAGFVLIVALACLRSAIVPFFFDMRYAIQSRIGGVGFGATIKLGLASVEILTAVALTVITVMLIARDRDWNRFAARLVLLCGAMVIGSLVLRRTDYGESGYQLATLWVILLIVKLAQAYPVAREKIAISSVVLICLAGIFVQFAHEAASLQTLLEYQLPSVQATAFRVPQMQHMAFYELEFATLDQFRFETGSSFVDYTDDGIYLLKKWTRPDESILTVGYSNPYPYLLRRKPAHGGSPWFHEGNDISKTHPLDAKLVFGDADLIVLPEFPSSHRDSDLDLQAIYHDYLMEHFTFVARSNWWILYRRNK